MGSSGQTPEDVIVGVEDVVEELEDVEEDGVAAGRMHAGVSEMFAAGSEKCDSHRLEQSPSPIVQLGQLPVHGADIVVMDTGFSVRE